MLMRVSFRSVDHRTNGAYWRSADLHGAKRSYPTSGEVEWVPYECLFVSKKLTITITKSVPQRLLQKLAILLNPGTI